jgi:uncharacterized protein (DUF2267 family)
MHPKSVKSRFAARTLTAWAYALVAAAAAWNAQQAAAQSSGLPVEIVAAQKALTADQRKTVAQFVEKQAQAFADADAAGVIQVRNDFIAILKKPTTAIAFRREYGLEFIKSFKKFAEGDDALRATNAFIMARFLATAESVDFLQDNLDPDGQKNIAIRISAAAQMPKAVAEAPLSGPQFDAIAKRLATACRRESDWIVAAHEVDAVVQILREDGLPTAQADSIAATLAGAINDLASRVTDGSQPQMVNALQRALLAVRNQLSGIASSARTKLLASIAPSLDTLSKLKGAPPKGIAEAQLESTFQAVVNTAGLLQKVRASGGTGA